MRGQRDAEGVLRWISLLCLASVSAAACAPVRRVAPIVPGQHVVSGSFGGPITEVGRGTGIYVPAPILSVGYNYGLRPVLDVEAGLQVTELLIGGMAFDAGINLRPIGPGGARPGIIIPLKLHFLVPFRVDHANAMRLYPDLGATALWRLGAHAFYTYVGFNLWFDLASRRDGNDGAARVLPAFHLGQTLGTDVWQFSFEVRYYTPNVSEAYRLVDVADLGGQGSLGLLLGFSVAIGGGGDS